ncbi:hypothetical protein DFH28DRAFT_1224971 [Melampsora americana]|nr:hypothetical protein DFH28DRAFT_1224971 [Melampsora americana]
MKKYFWYILIQPIIHSNLYAPVVHGISIDSIRQCTSHLIDRPIIDHPNGKEVENKWKELSSCIYHKDTKSLESQSNELDVFWKRFSEHNTLDTHYRSYLLPLVKKTNEILLSHKDHWERRMKEMLGKFTTDNTSSLEQISLFQILRGFLELKELPFKSFLVIDQHLTQTKEKGNRLASKIWWKELEETMKVSEKARTQLRWKQFSACTYPQRTTLTPSQSNAIEVFWKRCSENNQEEGHSPKYLKHLVRETNEILISEKGNWEGRMKAMLDKIKLDGSSVEQISLFQILREFITMKDLPPKVLEVIDSKLKAMEVAAKMPLEMKKWWIGLKETKELSEKAHERINLPKLAENLARSEKYLAQFNEQLDKIFFG